MRPTANTAARSPAVPAVPGRQAAAGLATVSRRLPLLALAVGCALVAGLSGCAAAEDPAAGAGAGSTAGGTPTADDGDGPDDAGGVDGCATADPGAWGDVVAKEPVTDEYGTYCHVTIDPAAAVLSYDKSKVDVASLTEFGFTEEDARAAQETAVTLLVEQVLDNSRLDNYTVTAKEWFAANDSIVLPEWRDAFMQNVDSGPNGTGFSRAGIFATDFLPSPLARDNGPRAQHAELDLVEISAINEVLLFELASVSSYEASDSGIVSAAIRNESTLTEDSLKASTPELFDGSDDSVVTLNATTFIGFEQGNTDQVGGIYSDMQMITSEGLVIFEND
jgi:phosphoribosylformylglycinamidine (FGAM) synthase PurS component